MRPSPSATTIAHRASNTRTSCLKQSQLCCVGTHEQPLVGEFSCKREQSIKLAGMLCRVQPRVNKVNFLLRQIHTSNPFRGEFSCQREQSIKLAWMLCRAQPIVNKVTFYCVGKHEQPRRGVRLFASTSPAGPALSPSFLRRGKSWLSECNDKCIWTLPSVKDFGEAKVFRRDCGTVSILCIA